MTDEMTVMGLVTVQPPAQSEMVRVVA